jgi:lipopolysaccharide export system permease protein
VVEGEHGPEIVVYGISRQEVDPATGRTRTTEAERSTVDLQQVQEAFSPRWKEPSERTLTELFAGAKDKDDTGFESAFRAELHSRIGSPFFAMALTMIALYTLLGGHFDRRGQSRRIIFSAVAVLLIQGMSIGLANLARNYWGAIPLLYLAAIVPGGLMFILFARANDGFQPWKPWLERILPPWAVFWQPA